MNRHGDSEDCTFTSVRGRRFKRRTRWPRIIVVRRDCRLSDILDSATENIAYSFGIAS
jgi:hypothetical protein